MDRRSIVAIASLGLTACVQGPAGEQPAPAMDVAGRCPGSTVTPATEPGAVPPCSCPPVPANTGDASGATLEASALPAIDAASTTSDGGIDPALLVALLGPPARSDPNPVLCPSNLSCQSFDGFPACMAQGALSPPTCKANADCVAAGMPGVPCVTLSIDIAGAVSLPFPVCLQLCNSP